MTTETKIEAQLDDGEFRLVTGLHVLPHGTDEVFVREGSRAAFSKVIRDEQRRGLLTRVLAAHTEPITRRGVATAIGAAQVDVDALVDVLLLEGVLSRADPTAVEAPVAIVGEGALADAVARFALDAGHEVGRIAQAADGSVEDIAALEHLDVLVAVADRLRPSVFRDLNAVALDSGTPVLYAWLDGPEINVGPYVTPGEGACYACHEIQDEGARHLRDEFLVFKSHLDEQVAPDPPPARVMLAASWVLLTVERLGRGESPFLGDRILRIETDRLEVFSHRVLQLPRCPACSRRRPDLQHTFA